MENTPRFLVFHCSDVSEKTLYDQFKSINMYHRDVRDFPISKLGYHVGYHYLITGGKIYKCREENEVGAHCNNKVNGVSMNFQSIGVCWGGDGDLELPSDTHLNLIKSLIGDLMDKYGIRLENVKFHRDFDLNGKTCPGSLITRKVFENWFIQKPKVVDPTELCTTDLVNKAKLWDTFISFIKSLIK